jgi:hypothetical protein
VIRWERGNDRPILASRTPGDYEQYGLISGSFLSAYNTVIQAEARGCGLVCSNSLLVGGRTVFQLDATGEDRNIAGAVALEGCTLSAGVAVFRVRTTNHRKRCSTPLLFLVENSVFAPPVAADPGSSTADAVTVLSSSRTARRLRQLDWWGKANGFSSVVQSSPGEQQATSGDSEDFATYWANTWGAEHVQRPLAGEGVTFSGPTPQLDHATASDFGVSTTSQAAIWSDLGGAIGIDVAGVASLTAKESLEQEGNDAGL